MSKFKLFAVIAVLLVTRAVNALSPTDGHVVNGAYVNTFFHISYTWPAILKPSAVPAQTIDAKTYSFPLFIARQGDQSYGIVVVAEKLDVPGPHSTGIKSSAEYISKVAGSLRPGPMLANITKSEKKNAHGVVFDELNFLMAGKPSSIMATQVGQYLIVFKCNAQSVDDIVQYENSALALRISK